MNTEAQRHGVFNCSFLIIHCSVSPSLRVHFLATNIRQNGQRAVLVRFHDFALARSFVVDAAQMEDAMDDGAVQLFVVRGMELLRVRADSVEANEQIAPDAVACRIVECNDIGIIIVLEVLAIHLQNLRVGAKDVAHVAYALAIRPGHFAHPARHSLLVDSRKFRVFRIKKDCHIVSFLFSAHKGTKEYGNNRVRLPSNAGNPEIIVEKKKAPLASFTKS